MDTTAAIAVMAITLVFTAPVTGMAMVIRLATATMMAMEPGIRITMATVTMARAAQPPMDFCSARWRAESLETTAVSSGTTVGAEPLGAQEPAYCSDQSSTQTVGQWSTVRLPS